MQSSSTPLAAAGVAPLVALRQQAGLTQVQLAVRADCSRASVALLEAGYEPKRSEVLKRVRAVLDQSTTSNGAPPQDAVAKTAEITGRAQPTP